MPEKGKTIREDRTMADGVRTGTVLTRGTWALSPTREVVCCATEHRPAPVIGRIEQGDSGWLALTADGEVIGSYEHESAACDATFDRVHPGWHAIPTTFRVSYVEPCAAPGCTDWLARDTRMSLTQAKATAKDLVREGKRDVIVKPNTAERECSH